MVMSGHHPISFRLMPDKETTGVQNG